MIAKPTPGGSDKYLWATREICVYWDMHGVDMCILQMHGVHVPYQERDMRYNITQGYLRKEGGGLVAQRGALHRKPVGTGKRGWDGAGVGGPMKGRRQAAAIPREQSRAEWPTQARKRGRESPARAEKRAR